MSHEKTDRDSISGTQQAWHGLSDVFPVIGTRCATSNPLARHDVKVTKLVTTDGKETGYSMMTATDDGLPVGLPFNPKTYSVFSNDKFLSMVEAVTATLDKLGVKWAIESAGTVRNRSLSFLSIKVEEASQFTVDGRVFQNYLSFLNSFDKSCRITVKDSSICVVCSNTFHATLADDKGAMAVSIAHRKNMANAVADVPKLLELAITNRANLMRRLQAFAAFPCGLIDAENVFAAFVSGQDDTVELSTRAANMAEKLANLFAKGKGNKGETALDLFQAATEYYTHYSAGDSENKFKQFESSDFGNGADKKTEFFNTLVDMTTVSGKFQAVARIGEKLLVAYRKKS